MSEYLKPNRGNRHSILSVQTALPYLQVFLNASNQAGINPDRARQIAVQRTYDKTGIDFSVLFRSSLPCETPLTPTELGELIRVSARTMNQLLKEAGLQSESNYCRWEATKKGNHYSITTPLKRVQEAAPDYTKYRILWYREVLDHLSLTDKQRATLGTKR